MSKLDRFVLFIIQTPLYIILLRKADGTAEFGQAIRWLYLFGEISERRLNKLDDRNFKKWNKVNKKDFSAYLDVARV